MSCPVDANTGFVHIKGPIPQNDLNSITVDEYPLIIAFGPQSTPPRLTGNNNINNHIDITSATDNTCTYLGTRYSLIDIQFCNVMNKGYKLPGQKDDPVMEMIFTYKSNKAVASVNDLSGILLSVFIYDSGAPNHDSYINKIANPSQTDKVPTLQSIFYATKVDTSQSSFAYTTCFETVTANATANTPKGTMQSKSVYVVLFPTGIRLASSIYQKLKTLVGNTLQPYMVPASLRDGNPTVQEYKKDANGTKLAKTTSSDGVIYGTIVASCDDEFKHRFQYFTKPPRLPTSGGIGSDLDQCPYYKTSQYKCVPFDELRDLSGEYVKPGNKTLEQIRLEQKAGTAAANPSSDSSISAETIENIVSGVIAGALLLTVAIYVGSKFSKNNPTP